MKLETADDRDVFIFGAVFAEPYDIKYFEELSTQEMQKLLDAGLACKNEQQNDSPTIEEFVDFCEEWNNKWPHNKLFMHGYVVSPDREDCRISVEGLICEHPSLYHDQMIIQFVEFNRFADELDLTPRLRSWWD